MLSNLKVITANIQVLGSIEDENHKTKWQLWMLSQNVKQYSSFILQKRELNFIETQMKRALEL